MKTEHKNLSSFTIFVPSFLAIENFQNHIILEFLVLSFAIWRNFAIKKRLGSRRFLQYTRCPPFRPKKNRPRKQAGKAGKKGPKNRSDSDPEFEPQFGPSGKVAAHRAARVRKLPHCNDDTTPTPLAACPLRFLPSSDHRNSPHTQLVRSMAW